MAGTYERPMSFGTAAAGFFGPIFEIKGEAILTKKGIAVAAAAGLTGYALLAGSEVGKQIDAELGTHILQRPLLDDDVTDFVYAHVPNEPVPVAAFFDIIGREVNGISLGEAVTLIVAGLALGGGILAAGRYGFTPVYNRRTNN